jgi:hypothetical protein
MLVNSEYSSRVPCSRVVVVVVADFSGSHVTCHTSQLYPCPLTLLLNSPPRSFHRLRLGPARDNTLDQPTVHPSQMVIQLTQQATHTAHTAHSHSRGTLSHHTKPSNVLSHPTHSPAGALPLTGLSEFSVLSTKVFQSYS